MAIDWPELGFRDRSQNRVELEEFLSQFVPPELKRTVQGFDEYLNPITVYDDATIKGGEFGASLTDDKPGVDLQAGLGSLVNTAEFGTLPLSYALSLIKYGKEPVKAGIMALKEMFYPTGATDDVVEATGKGLTRRQALAGGTALASAPLVRGIEGLLPQPAKQAAKTSLGILKDSIQAASNFEKIGTNLERQIKKIDIAHLHDLLRDERLGTITESVDSGIAKSSKLKQESLKAFEELAKAQNTIAKASIEDLRKLSTEELQEIARQALYDPRPGGQYNTEGLTSLFYKDQEVRKKIFRILDERSENFDYSKLFDTVFREKQSDREKMLQKITEKRMGSKKE